MQPFDDVASNTSSRRSRSSAVGADVASRSTPVTFHFPSLTRFMTRKFPLFNILLTFKRPNIHVISILGLVIFMMQQLGFLFNPHFDEMWSSGAERVISRVLYITQLPFYDPLIVTKVQPVVGLVIAYVLLFLVILLLVLIVLERLKNEDEEDLSGPSAAAARVMLEVASTVLLVPIFQFCFASAICDNLGYMWLFSSDTTQTEAARCWGAYHIATLVPCLVVIIALIPLLYITTTCMYDYNPFTSNFLASRHATMEVMSFVRRLLSCFMFNMLVAYKTTIGFAVVQALTSFAMIVGYMYYLPYYSININMVFVAMHTVEFVAAIVVSVQEGSYTLQALYCPLVAWICFALVGSAVTVGLTSYRVNPRFRSAMFVAARCSSAYRERAPRDSVVATDERDYDEDEEGAGAGRAMSELDALIDGEESDGEASSTASVFAINDAVIEALPFPSGIDTSPMFYKYTQFTQQVVQCIARQRANNMLNDDGLGGEQQSKAMQVLEPFIEHVHSPADVDLAASFVDAYARRFGISQVSSLMTVFAAHIYLKAITTFPSESWVRQTFATYIMTYIPGMSFMAVDLIKQTMRMSPTVSQNFRALKQSEELRIVLGIRTHAHGIRCTKARTAHAKALRSLHLFWAKFIEPSVDMKEVSEVADEIHEKRDLAVRYFESAIKHQQNPDHLLIHRLGDFFAEVIMAPDAAQECYIESREIYQTRQARSMRGTRKNTTDIDVEALKERMLRLLHFHHKGGTLNTSGAAREIWCFALLITVFFALLVCCCIGFLVVANVVSTDLSAFLESIYAASELSIMSSRFSSFVVSAWIANTSVTSGDAFDLSMNELSSFTRSLYTLTSTASAPRSSAAVEFISLPSIPVYIPAVSNTKPYSLLSLSEACLQAMIETISDIRTRQSTRRVPLNLFLVDAAWALSTAYKNLVTILGAQERMYLAVRWDIMFFALFILNALFLVGCFVALLLSFRRTTLRRIFTFQLFTLIPYESVERLAVELKDKCRQMRQERALKSTPKSMTDTLTKVAYSPEGHAAPPSGPALLGSPTTAAGAAGVASHEGGSAGNAIMTPVKTSPTTTSPTTATAATTTATASGNAAAGRTAEAAAAATAPQEATASATTGGEGNQRASPVVAAAPKSILVSCLKKRRPSISGVGLSFTNLSAREPTVVKHVRFNPVVHVVGGDGEEEAAKHEDTTTVEESEEEAEHRMRLQLLRSQRRKRAAIAKAAVARGRHTASLWVVVYLIATLVIIVAIIAMLAYYYYVYQYHDSIIDRNLDIQAQISTLSLDLQRAVRSAVHFTASGSAVNFIHVHKYMSSVIQTIPSLTSPNLPSEAVNNLLQMHDYAKKIGNMTLHACVLAGTVDSDQVYFDPETVPWAGMNATDVVGFMGQIYPDESVEMERLVKHFSALDRTKTFALMILSKGLSDKLEDFRVLYTMTLQLVKGMMHEQLDMRCNVIIACIALSALGATLSFIIGFTPLYNSVAMLIPRTRVRLAALSFLPALAMCIVIYTCSLRAQRNYDIRGDDLLQLHSIFSSVLQRGDLGTTFAFTQNSEVWFTMQAVPSFSTINDFAPVLDARYLSTDIITIFSTLADRCNELERMVNVSATLTINSWADTIKFEPMMLAGVKAAEWDITLEKDYNDYLLEAKEDNFYSDKQTDMSMPLQDQYLTALNVVTSEEFRRQTMSVTDMVGDLYNEVRAAQAAHMRSAMSPQKLYTIIALILSMLPLTMLILLVCASGSRVIDRLYMSSSKEQISQGTSARYRSTLRRVQFSLILIVLFCLTIAGVGVWLSQLASGLIPQITFFNNQRDMAATVSAMAMEFAAPYPTFIAPASLNQQTSDIAMLLIKQMQPRAIHGVPAGFQFSSEADRMMYGALVPDAQMRIVLSWLKTNCSDYCTGMTNGLPMTPSPRYGYGTDRPILESLFDLQSIIGQYARTIDDTESITSFALHNIVPTLFNTTTYVLSALNDTGNVATAALGQHKDAYLRILVILVAVDMACIVLVYFCIIAPVVVHQVREEAASRLLLQIIPPDVRDQVPAITHHIDTGEMSNANELRLKFEANEKLLQNILPPKISARLKSGELPIADKHECVTILFTDFVGFTKRSSTMMAREIVDFLNEVFLEFDTIVELLQLEKIKTIGDAFFMAGGLDPLIKDHALRVVEAGLMFFDALEEHNRRHPSRAPLQMRLGVHSGPVVAGVIGIKKVAFDLWGDTVEIANAMESTGVPGCVHVSEDTAQFIRGFFRLVPRGELPREKEHIPENMPKTYLVVGRLLPTPYMTLRRPKLLPINLLEGNM